MKYNPDKHHRRSIRLKNYDYSQEGLYFITICVQNRLCLFGKIKNGENILFESGKMIEKIWLELENKYDTIKLHEFIVMPNHFHGIIEIIKNDNVNIENIVGAIPCGCPNDDDCGCPNGDDRGCPNGDENIGNTGQAQGIARTENKNCEIVNIEYKYNKNTIGNIIGGFKSLTTNEYIKMVKNGISKPFNKKLWQRNYYENIIRNEKSYLNISEYIKNNPLKWDEDRFYYTEI